MNTYNAVAYTDGAQDPQYRLDRVPDRWALRIDLNYPDGGAVVFIYPQMPSDQEQRDLMWQLQTAAGPGRFTIVRIDADGTREDIPALGRRSR